MFYIGFYMFRIVLSYILKLCFIFSILDHFSNNNITSATSSSMTTTTTLATTMATSTMPGTTATGGVLRRVAAMLGTGT